MISYARSRVAQHILLLRGINLAGRNRIAMPALRDVLTEAGFGDVRTYLQSGNVVLSSTTKADAVLRKVKRLIAEEFDLDIAVVARTRAQIAQVVKRNPLGQVATNPKLYQVSFLEARPTRELIQRIEAAATPREKVVAVGREVYAWHPEGVARSRLWTLLAGQQLGVTATSRNWTTVTNLLELATKPR
jgi:uncharacterized protein (DUF1697 family)